MWTEIYTTKEAAKYVKMSYWDMVTLLRHNVIPHERIGCAFFITQVALDKWIETQKINKEKNYNEENQCDK